MPHRQRGWERATQFFNMEREGDWKRVVLLILQNIFHATTDLERASEGI